MNESVKLFSAISHVHYFLLPTALFVVWYIVEREQSWNSNDMGSSHNFVAL